MTIRNRISFNANGQRIGDTGHFKQTVLEMRPSTLLIMDSLKFADEMYGMLGGECKVIYRQYEDGESSFWRKDNQWYLSPKDLVARWKAEGYKHIVRHALNEPGIFPDKKTELLSWLIEVMQRSADENISVVVGNFAVGNWEMSDINTGVLDNYLKALGTYNNIHYSGVHEYSTFMLPYGVGQWQVSRMYDINQVQKDSWLPASSLPYTRWNGNLPPYWLLLRSAWMDIRAKEIGAQPHKRILTEYGWDRMLDGQGMEQFLNHLRNRYGSNGHDDMLGIDSYGVVYQDYFKGVPFQQAIYDQLAWANTLYPDNVVGMCLFTWSIDDGWNRKYGTNFSDYKQLHRMFVDKPLGFSINWQQPPVTPPVVVPPVVVPPVVTPPTTPTGAFKLKPKAAPLNIREAGGTQFKVIETVTSGTVLTCVDSEECVRPKLGNTSKWIEVVTPSGKQGWAAAWLLILT